ncbi:hypothetical protein Sjap_010520 [Stephania japonica]|uniref:Glycosyltransferase n=1 Tax=Stephania japonica TaxID=461633 RepID=A0AAP0J9R6_9MAGN
MDANYQVIVFPWFAFGHMLPFLEFSKRLAANSIHVHFVSSPKNIQRLPTIPKDLASLINLVQIPLPSVEGLPENAEATIDLPLEQVQYLKKAYDEMQGSFEKLVGQILPDLVVFDFISCWVPETAAKFGIPSAFLSAFSAATLAFIGPPAELRSNSRVKEEDFQVVPEWIPFPSTVAYPSFQAKQICHNINIPDVTGKSSGERLAVTLEGCSFVLVRGCEEFDGEYIHLLHELYQKPVIPVGLLPPRPIDRTSTRTKEANWSDNFTWLDKHSPRSVLFVGFGSEYKLSIDQVHELAYGLELADIPFIWALKKPEGINSSNLLPPGFQDRILDRGLVCLGWAPQLEILDHPAIGGCIFHSGWGSIVESLFYGHNLILLPMMADQGLNARLMVDKGIGLEVERSADGSFTRTAIARSIRLVMFKQEGEPLRVKAGQMRSIFANQALHENYTKRFVQFIGCCKRNEHLLPEKVKD